MARIAHRGWRPGAVVPIALALVLVLAAACAGAPPSPSPTPVRTPVVTPDPHLALPATAGQVFTGLGRAGLRITPNSASAYDETASVVTRINATYADWPLDVFEFRTADDLARTTAAWKAGKSPGKGDPPISLTGHNILVTWGPRSTDRRPTAPDPEQTAALEELVDAMETLLSPLRAMSVVPIELAAAAPGAAAPAEPSTEPEATPAP